MTYAEYVARNPSKENDTNEQKDRVALMLKLIAQLNASRLEEINHVNTPHQGEHNHDTDCNKQSVNHRQIMSSRDIVAQRKPQGKQSQ